MGIHSSALMKLLIDVYKIDKYWCPKINQESRKHSGNYTV